MDTLLLHCSSPANFKPRSKRPCCPSSSASSTAADLQPNPTACSRLSSSRLDNDLMDSLLESLLGLSDSPSGFLEHSFDRLLQSRSRDSDQKDLIERALTLGSALLEVGKRSARHRASMHNSTAWVLPPDLTMKVFSLLDTQSVCYAAATCTFFRKCAADPSCYTDIDLITVVPKPGVGHNLLLSVGGGLNRKVDMWLWSLKVGIVSGPLSASSGSSQPLIFSMRNSTDPSGFSWTDKRSRQGKESYILTRSCLAPLSADGNTSGAFLKRLHLYNIERMDNMSLSVALSACPSLQDLEIVGLHVELRQTLESVSKCCPCIERLFFESSKTGRDDSLKLPTCSALVNNCPHLSSLALRGFKLQDYKARALVKGFHRLKYVDFSTSYSISGAFLKSLGGSNGGSLLEVLILRDCMHLKEVEVGRFLSAVLTGDFRSLKYLDISNREGLAADGDWSHDLHRCCSTDLFPIKQLLEERPNLRILADFPSEGSFNEFGQIVSSDSNGDSSSRTMLSSHTSDGSLALNSSESSYNSDAGSGNEDSQSTSFMLYGESSDEVEFLSLDRF